MSLAVIGLGPGNPDLLTTGALRALERADEVWARTLKHPTLEHLNLGAKLHSFDELYDSLSTSDEVYKGIAKLLVHKAKKAPTSEIVYAVPGSPTTGERSVAVLREEAEAGGIAINVLPGISALEAALTELRVDPLETGFQALDADDIANLLDTRPSVVSQMLNPTIPLLISGVWNNSLASATKLFLLSMYPPSWQVKLVRASLGEGVREVELENLDRGISVDHLTTLYVPPLQPDTPGSSFYQLTYITARLRGPGGCPWDREQTHDSIKRNMLEEAYEAVEALDENDITAFEEELGDVLLQVSLQSEIGYSDSDFDIADVIQGITAKLVRRHPHVFGDVKADSAAQVLANWQEIKQGERADKGSESPSVLDGVPAALPALARAQSMSNRAAKTGFDWGDSAEVREKISEELAELDVATSLDEKMEELGDVLFVLVNWARFHGLEAEEAMRKATLKFERRFRALETLARENNKEIKQHSAEELDRIWNRVKANERVDSLEV